MERLYEDTKKMVEHEIEMIVQKEEMTPTDLEMLGELVDIVKDICEIDEDEEMKHEGHSGKIGSMPYYGAIMYDDSQWNNRYRDRGSSYGRDGGDRYGRGSSYGRYEDGRMMPSDRSWN